MTSIFCDVNIEFNTRFQSLVPFYYLWFNNKPHYKYTRTSSVVTALFGVALPPQSTMTTDATKERTSNMATCGHLMEHLGENPECVYCDCLLASQTIVSYSVQRLSLWSYCVLLSLADSVSHHSCAILFANLACQPLEQQISYRI